MYGGREDLRRGEAAGGAHGSAAVPLPRPCAIAAWPEPQRRAVRSPQGDSPRPRGRLLGEYVRMQCAYLSTAGTPLRAVRDTRRAEQPGGSKQLKEFSYDVTAKDAEYEVGAPAVQLCSNSDSDVPSQSWPMPWNQWAAHVVPCHGFSCWLLQKQAVPPTPNSTFRWTLPEHQPKHMAPSHFLAAAEAGSAPDAQ